MNFENLKHAAGGALLATVFLGLIGIPDTDQRKLPLTALVAIIYTAWASRGNP